MPRKRRGKPGPLDKGKRVDAHEESSAKETIEWSTSNQSSEDESRAVEVVNEQGKGAVEAEKKARSSVSQETEKGDRFSIIQSHAWCRGD